ncbi:MAG: hypothetical protein MUP27_07850 [Desulfobacterales bacterium]|nr:hypothetical protein [Desulfobacterales bacterium]
MASSRMIGNKDSKAFFKVFGTAIGTLGGFAALFIAFGYITLQSFLSNMELYGLAYFPLQFYKEASVTFLRDIFRFYSEKPIFMLPAVAICLLPFLFRKVEKDMCTSLIRFLAISGLLLAGTVVFFTFALGILRNLSLKQIVFNAISLPVIFALFLFLADNFSKLKLKKPFENLYVSFLLIFVFLFLSIPVGYGSYLYDVTVFTVSVPECNSENTAFGKSPSKRYRLLYLMGHTSEREVFFDATAPPISVILVDKKLINSIRVEFSKTQTQTLRALYDLPNKEFFDDTMKDQENIIPGEVELFGREQLDEWMLKKDELPKIKEKKDAEK